jgi:hypothetical protein
MKRSGVKPTFSQVAPKLDSTNKYYCMKQRLPVPYSFRKKGPIFVKAFLQKDTGTCLKVAEKFSKFM